MSINRIAIWIVATGYILVNGMLQIDFFVGRNVFAKYAGKNPPTGSVDMLSIASDAYYAKTGFLLILILLQVAGLSFALSLAVSLTAYAAMMLAFFGVEPPTVLFAMGGLSLIATYLWDRSRGILRGYGRDIV